MLQVVDGDIEVIAEWKAETVSGDIAVSGHEGGEPGLPRPAFTSIRGTSIVDVPMRLVSLVHPGDSHVACVSRGDCPRADGRSR